MLRIWDTKAPDPSVLCPAVSGADSYGFSRDAKAANLYKATAPDPHFKTPLEAPLTKATGFGFEDRDGWRINAWRGMGISFSKNIFALK